MSFFPTPPVYSNSTNTWPNIPLETLEIIQAIRYNRVGANNIAVWETRILLHRGVENGNFLRPAFLLFILSSNYTAMQYKFQDKTSCKNISAILRSGH